MGAGSGHPAGPVCVLREAVCVNTLSMRRPPLAALRAPADVPKCCCCASVVAAQDFREGKFNTLVATCIGEEGLDLPQVRFAAGADVCRLRYFCLLPAAAAAVTA